MAKGFARALRRLRSLCFRHSPGRSFIFITAKLQKIIRITAAERSLPQPNLRKADCYAFVLRVAAQTPRGQKTAN